jgi:hypothetical protein
MGLSYAKVLLPAEISVGPRKFLRMRCAIRVPSVLLSVKCFYILRKHSQHALHLLRPCWYGDK